MSPPLNHLSYHQKIVNDILSVLLAQPCVGKEQKAPYASQAWNMKRWVEKVNLIAHTMQGVGFEIVMNKMNQIVKAALDFFWINVWYTKK